MKLLCFFWRLRSGNGFDNFFFLSSFKTQTNFCNIGAETIFCTFSNLHFNYFELLDAIFQIINIFSLHRYLKMMSFQKPFVKNVKVGSKEFDRFLKAVSMRTRN